MKILCASCLKEGKPALMGQCEPLDDPTEIHAICPEHRREVEQEPTHLQMIERSPLTESALERCNAAVHDLLPVLNQHLLHIHLLLTGYRLELWGHFRPPAPLRGPQDPGLVRTSPPPKPGEPAATSPQRPTGYRLGCPRAGRAAGRALARRPRGCGPARHPHRLERSPCVAQA